MPRTHPRQRRRPQQVDQTAPASQGWPRRYPSPDRRRLPGLLAPGGHRTQPGPADLRHLRDVRPALPPPRPGYEAPRSAPAARRADLDQPGGPDLPVPCARQGFCPTGGKAALLRPRTMLRCPALRSDGQRHPRCAAGGSLAGPGRRPHHEEPRLVRQDRDGSSAQRQSLVQRGSAKVSRISPAG
jgi:hypothetical protein